MGKKKSREPIPTVATPPPPPLTPAQNEALSTLVIVTAILKNLDDSHLLSSMQRVCRLWKEVATDLVQPHFSLHEAERVADKEPHSISPNTLLAQHFHALLSNITEPRRISMETVFYRGGYVDRSALGMSIANTSCGKIQHKAFIRQGASWRNMLVSSPPIFEVEFVADRTAHSPPRDEIVCIPEGLRMGQLYDLVVAIITRADKNGIYDAVVEWPSLEPDGKQDGVTGGDGDGQLPPLVVRKVFEAFPPSYTKWDEKTKRARTRHVASTKWMLLCEEFDKDKLIVNPW
ncbi:F-box-like domain-containing protein [Pochonia chlamydosporia 170]|uniref:F-box-like domain-containing protein n=1 Tax=Pochonia chlamydosporia 170 TaxID=1380566 RepID=A0A179FHK2_METCM|nr:F-box-like domain-containing protein [Pochonia chlamydosporia 170]OAQ64519.1 F-box-like domain-containing protein [Pochonia chlamydosporia 170]